MTREKGTHEELVQQAKLLARLRGRRDKTEWAATIDVPYRTYLRYEAAEGKIAAERIAPPSVIKLARLMARDRSPSKRGA